MFRGVLLRLTGQQGRLELDGLRATLHVEGVDGYCVPIARL